MATKDQEGPLIVAIGGGKGGVGKSVVAANLAVAVARLGARVIAVDGDLGSANLHTMFAIDRPGLTMHALLEGHIKTLQEAVVATSEPRLGLVPGNAALPGSANLMHSRKLKLIRHVRKLDADVVVLDCGAGVHFNVVDLYNAADARLLVATPQLVSLQNAYGFTKSAVYRRLKDLCGDPRRKQILKEATGTSETDRMQQLLVQVQDQDARFADEIRQQLRTFGVTLLGNQVGDRKELNPIHALSRMIGDFLNVEVPVVGALRRSGRIHYSVSKREPFLNDAAGDMESRVLMVLARSYLELDPQAIRAQRAGVAGDVPPGSEQAEKKVPGPATDLPASISVYERVHERIEVVWSVALEVAGRSFGAQVRDVSRGGAWVVWGGQLKRGSSVSLRFHRLPDQPTVLGTVAHVRADGIGVEFDETVASELIETILRHALGSQAA